MVDVDGLEIDFNPSGNMLMFNNPDAPGMLRAVAAILSDKGVSRGRTRGPPGGKGERRRARRWVCSFIARLLSII